MRIPANPFILSGYHSPKYFCDREKEFAWLKEQFEIERKWCYIAGEGSAKQH